MDRAGAGLVSCQLSCATKSKVSTHEQESQLIASAGEIVQTPVLLPRK
jgi:hypothetical protein